MDDRNCTSGQCQVKPQLTLDLSEASLSSFREWAKKCSEENGPLGAPYRYMLCSVLSELPMIDPSAGGVTGSHLTQGSPTPLGQLDAQGGHHSRVGKRSSDEDDEDDFTEDEAEFSGDEEEDQSLLSRNSFCNRAVFVVGGSEIPSEGSPSMSAVVTSESVSVQGEQDEVEEGTTMGVSSSGESQIDRGGVPTLGLTSEDAPH